MSIVKHADGFQIRAEKTFTQEEFDLFARVSGDDNPIHVDPEFSAQSKFGRTVSHGMLLYTIMWGHIQRHFPKSTQLTQNLMFPAPTYTGEPVEITLDISPVEGDKTNTFKVVGQMRRKHDNEVTCDAESLIQYSGALPC